MTVNPGFAGQKAVPETIAKIHETRELLAKHCLAPVSYTHLDVYKRQTQHSVKELQGMGVNPDIIVLRTDEKIEDPSIVRKIANFCNVRPDCVIENTTLPILYEAPLMLEEAHLSDIVCRELQIEAPAPDMTQWREMVDRIRHPQGTVRIAMVGKYMQLHDAYLSVTEALRHAAYALGRSVYIDYVAVSYTHLQCFKKR